MPRVMLVVSLGCDLSEARQARLASVEIQFDERIDLYEVYAILSRLRLSWRFMQDVRRFDIVTNRIVSLNFGRQRVYAMFSLHRHGL